MLAVAATFAGFSLLSALAWSVPSLMVARFLLGLTIGVSVVVVPVFVAESAAPEVRGALLVLYQVAVTGIIAGYLVAWALSGTESWRWMLGMAAIPGTLIFFLLLRLPDTARWYMMRGRRADAERVFAQVEPGPISKPILMTWRQLAEEEHGKRGILSLIGEMLRSRSSAPPSSSLASGSSSRSPASMPSSTTAPNLRGYGFPGQLRPPRVAGIGAGCRARGCLRLADLGRSDGPCRRSCSPASAS